MKNSEIIVAHVHNNWNVVALLLYIAKARPRRLIIIIESRKVSIFKYFKKDIVNLEIELIDASDFLGKLSCLARVIRYGIVKETITYVKFTNFSYFGQLLQKAGKFDQVVFLDEGTTFLNILDDSIVYMSRFRKFLKELLWPSGFEPRFDCFNGVSVAYLNQVSLIQSELDDLGVYYKDFGTLFSFAKLREITNLYLLIDNEIERWLDLIGNHDVIVLGSSLVEHGFMLPESYDELLSSVVGSEFRAVVYKPHPSEIIRVLPKRHVDWTYYSLSDLPVELLFCHRIPKKLVSFGSTTSFLLISNEVDLENYIFLPNNLYCDSSFDALSNLSCEGLFFKRITTTR